jgi:hypothetical protein
MQIVHLLAGMASKGNLDAWFVFHVAHNVTIAEAARVAPEHWTTASGCRFFAQCGHFAEVHKTQKGDACHCKTILRRPSKPSSIPAVRTRTGRRKSRSEGRLH